MAARDLCEISDVHALIPGYTPDEGEIDGELETLITSVSLDTYDEIGREFTPRVENPDTRVFEVDWWVCEKREIEVGDLAAIDDDFVLTISSPDGTVLQTLQTGAVVALPRSRDAWKPITSLKLPRIALVPAEAAVLAPGYLINVTGTFGFPDIPANVKTAVAKLVIVRYVTDATESGNQLIDAMAGLNVGVLYASATSTLQGYRVPAIG